MNSEFEYIDEMVKSVLKKLLNDEYMPSLINSKDIKSLILVSNFLIEQKELTLSDETKFLALSGINVISTKYYDIVAEDMNILHLLYVLNIFVNSESYEYMIENYFQVLANFRDILNIQANFDLIETIFGPDKWDFYYTKFAQYLFDDNFWNFSYIVQQTRIYVYGYFSMRFIYFGGHSRVKYKELYKVFKKALDIGNDNVLLYLHTPLNFAWNGISKTQDDMKIFNDEVERPLSEYIQTNMMAKYGIVENTKELTYSGKIRIGFLFHYIHNTSVDKVHYDLLKLLSENNNEKYEILVINIRYPEKGLYSQELVDDVMALGFEYIDCCIVDNGDESVCYDIVNRNIKIRNLIMSKNIDILIGFNTRVEYNFLFSTRTCSRQVYWSHGNYVYDINGIDYRIKHGFIGDDYEIHYGKTFLQFPDYLSEDILNKEVSYEELQYYRDLYPKDKIVLGTIGRLLKINSKEYLSVIFNVMEKYENTIYLVCGSGESDTLKQEIEKRGLSKRWFFEGYVDANYYGHIIDIWPNTFPYNQGLSTLEAVAKGKMNIQMITKQFSKTDAQLESLEKIFLEYNCDFDKLLKDDRVKEEVSKYLEKNFFPSSEVTNTKNIIPTILYLPTNTLESYQAKLEYTIRNFDILKDNIKHFSKTMAKSRWMNKKECTRKFLGIMDKIYYEN